MSDRTTEYALLANEAYKYTPRGQSITVGSREYVVDDEAMDVVTGFYAASYRDLQSGRFIIAYRGTDDLSDGIVDVGMTASRFDLQQLESEMFTRRVIDRARDFSETTGNPFEVTVTGHSLGGGLAEANASNFGLRGETFNAYGAAGLIRGTPDGGAQMINHVRAGDPVSAANRHFGAVKIYATPDDITTLKQAGYGGERATGLGTTARSITLGSHSMSNFIPKDGETSLVSPEGEARYRANRDLIDHYRSDVLQSRETVTRAFETSTLLGPALAVRAHPGNALFEQTLRGVYVLDAKTDRLPDQMSVNLAGSLTVEARREGLTRIDHVVLSDDASRTYAIQGELNSPFKRLAEVPTEIGIATSIETSSAQWQMVGSQDVSHQMDSRQIAQQASHVEPPQMQAPIHAAPSMSR